MARTRGLTTAAVTVVGVIGFVGLLVIAARATSHVLALRVGTVAWFVMFGALRVLTDRGRF